MIKNRFIRTIKTISFALAITVLWQSIVMAAPDVFSRDNILPRTLCFNTPDENTGFSSVMAGYITRVLSRAVSVPGNRNLSDLKAVLRDELSRLAVSGDIPDELRGRIPEVKGDPGEGQLLLDLGGCFIRLYNHRMIEPDPGFPCEVIRQSRLGEYLTLQELSSPDIPSGMIARGDGNELFGALVERDPHLRELDRKQIRMLRSSYRAIRKRVKKAGLDRDIFRRIKNILGEITLKELPDILKRIEPVVLLEEEDRTDPRGWLISFNTMPETAAEGSGVEGTLFDLLKGAYPGTVALCSRALEISSTDRLLREEYLLHELLCPYLGHEKAREIQEKLYPENYDGYYGDTGSGHRDGELSLMIKQILWENCGALREEDVAVDVIHRELEEFRKVDFTSNGPSRASHFFYDHYKRWQEWNRRFVLLHFSRQRNRGKQHIRNWIEHIDLQYNYVFAKLSWLWTMETVWTRRRAFLRNESAEENIGARRITDLNEEDVTDILPVIRELIDTHNNFMSSSRWAKYIEEDPYINIIVDKLYRLSGQRRIPVRNEDVGSREIEVRTPARGEGKADRRGEKIRSGGNEHLQSSSRGKGSGVKSPGPSFRQRIRLMLVNWPQLIPIVFTTAVLTLVFWALLPVNVWTVGIASVFTLGVFVYLLARNWSWGKLLFAAVFCLAAGYLLPVPWLGLSLAVTMLTMHIMQGPEPDRKSLEMARRRRESAGAEGHTGGGKTREDEREGISRNISVEGLDLSEDLAGPFLELIAYLLGDTAGSEQAGSDNAKAVVEMEVDQKKFLDLAFKLAPEENIPVSEDLKKQLRPYVTKKLSELENGFDFDMRNAIITLRIWREAGTYDLAEALQEVTQEVSSRLLTSDHPGESSRELEAVRELIAENYGIPEAKLEQVKEILYIQLLRDRIQQDELVGIHDPDKYYTLGRLEFRAGNMKAADTAFSLAVNFESVKEEPRAEFFMALGLINHYLDEWDQAGQSYTIALNIWEMKDEPTELDRLRKDLTEVLLEKTTGHERIDGTREDGEDIGRMGRNVYVHSVESREDGYHALVKVPGKSYIVADLPLRYGHLVTRPAMEEGLSPVVKGARNRRVFDAILDEVDGHSFYMYFFEDDPYGLKGFAYPAEDIIALHSSLRDHPVAVFHEIMEAMVRNRKGEKRQALMKMELDGEGRLVIKTRPRPSGGFRKIAVVRLSARTEEFIASEKWKDTWRKDPHYLLRALQYELFGEYDTGLTEKIKGPVSVCDLFRMPGILPVSRELRLTGADRSSAGTAESDDTYPSRSNFMELKRNIEEFSARYADMVIRGLGMGEEENARELRSDISFAVEEIVQNAYVHGNKLDLGLDVVLRWDKRGDSLVLEVEDRAVRGRPGAELMQAARQAGLHGQSVGLQVVAIDFRVERSATPEGGNVYTLSKRLTGGKDIVECDMSALPPELPVAEAYRLTGAGEVSLEDTRTLNELRMAAPVITGSRSGGPFTLRCLRLGMDIVRFTGMFADMLSDHPEIRSLPADEIERLRNDITMSLDEALKNAYVHGNGMDLSLDVIFRWKVREGTLVLEVEDHNVEVPAGSRKMAVARQTRLHGAGSGTSFMEKYFNVRRSGPDPGKGKKLVVLSRELGKVRPSRDAVDDTEVKGVLSGLLPDMPGMKKLFPAEWLRFLEEELSARPGGERELRKIAEDLEKIFLSDNDTLLRSLGGFWDLLSVREYLRGVVEKGYEEKVRSIVLARTFLYPAVHHGGAGFLQKLTEDLKSLVSGEEKTLEELREELTRTPMEFVARYSSGMRMKERVTQNTFREDPLSPGERIKRGEPVKLLFVCQLNANRSFLLDIISRDIVRSRPELAGVSIDSCGIAVPFTAHYDLAKAALDRGVPAEIAAEFSPKKISRELLENADHVVAADASVTVYIERNFPRYAGKLVTVPDILPDMTRRLFESAGDMELGRYMLDYLAVDEVIPPVDYYDILREGLEKELFGLRGPADDPMPVEDAEDDDARDVSELSRVLYGSDTGHLRASIIRGLIAKQAGGKGSAYVKVCRHNGRPVAYIIAGNSPLDGRKRLNIAQIVVDEAYRRRGLARKLFRAVYNEAREDGYDLFSVMTGARAVTGICLAHGFTEDAAAGEMVLDHSNDTAPAYVPRPGGPDRSSIVDNARYVIPRMVNALVTASRQRRKVVLALDTGLGKGDVNSFIRKLIWRLPALESNNRDLELFLRDLEIISGPAAVLARRLDNITDAERGGVRAENVIVVTSSGEMDTFSGLDGRSVIAAVDDRCLPERAYMPYVQVLFFALGKYLGWDRERMEECYRLIPNAVPLEEMSGDGLDLLDPARRSFLIRLIPDAVKFNREVQIEMNEYIREMLAMA